MINTVYIPFNDTVAITASDYIQAAGITRNTYDSDKRRGYITLLKRGGNGREALIDFNLIKKKERRAAIIKKLGEPVGVYKTPYIKEILRDQEAVEYFNSYRYDEDKALPDVAKEQYANEAAILNTIKNVLTRQLAARARNGKRKKMYEFWGEAVGWISDETISQEWGHSLPTNPRALERKFKLFLKEGYYALIHKGYGNGNADKLVQDAKKWLVARFASPVERVTTKQLFEEYNEISESRGWAKLASEATIHQYLHLPEVEPLWYAMRYGELKAKEKFTRQHRTLLPTMRDSVWYSDGTKLNYYYLDENGKIATCNVYEVIDAYSECLLGYHISKSEDFEAQYLAYRMALQFSGERPYEIRYDNQGGHKKLENGGFLQKMAHLAINTMPYNGKSKTIESAFGRFQAEFLHREWYFTGQNITTKKEESKANMEFILANKANLPTLEEVKTRYKQRRDEWNSAKHFDTGRARIEMYRESVNPKATKITWFDMLELFGILTDAPITYRASGIEIQVKRIKYAYEVLNKDGHPDHDFLEKNVGRKFFVKYDLQDMSVVSLFIKDHSGFRFVTLAEKYLDIHRGKQEQADDEAAFIKQQELINKQRRLNRQDKIEIMMEEEGLHPAQHGLIMPGVKGIKGSSKSKEKTAKKEVVDVQEIGEYLKVESNVDLMDILNRY